MPDAEIRPRRNARLTREAILSAAQDAFSISGYTDTGVRDITAAAGVNPALVSRYFGSKEKLYEAALSALLDAEIITNLPREDFGERVVQMLTSVQAGQRNPLPMMMLASADPTARAITDRLLKDIFVEPLTNWYGPDQGAGKAACFAVIASGLTIYRAIYPLAALNGDLDGHTRRWLVNAFQSLID